jgi:hypothetical protein
VEIRCAVHVAPYIGKKLAVTLPTGDGRSVGIVRSRTQATELECGKSESSLYVFTIWPPVPVRIIHDDECGTVGVMSGR